jgi:4-hydroxy-2-oxoheptanedioate aldolase
VQTDVNSDTIKGKWATGATTIGGWLSLRDPFLSEMTASLGFDYVCVDMQHGLSELKDAFTSIQAMSRHTGVTPIMRVPWNEPGIIGRSLDFGAMGVIVPMVNSVEEAEAAVAACRYAPVGKRSSGPIVPQNRWGGNYFTDANERVACIVMIETEIAVARIDEILAVPGIDAVYVGPADLSITLGLQPAMDQTADVFTNALTTIVAACRRHNVIPGIHASGALAGKRHAQGFRMITIANDLVSAVAGLRNEIAAARGGIDGTAPAPASGASSDPYKA